MKVDAWNLSVALKLVGAIQGEDPNVIADKAHIAIIQLGYRAGAASGNPISFLRDFFRTEIRPVFEMQRKLLLITISETVLHMRKEGYSGPISQTVFAHAVLGDALMKIMSLQPGLNWGGLSTPDWLSIAICFSLWLKGDASGAIKQLLADIEKAMDN